MTKRSKNAWMKWRRLVSEQAGSGQSVKAFCREHGLRRPYFFVWKKRLEENANKVPGSANGGAWAEHARRFER
jgi:transposase-like protein